MAYENPDDTSIVVNLVKCSLEIKKRDAGGVYLSCRDVRCDGTCLLYIVDPPKSAKIYCECVHGHGTCKLVRKDRPKGGFYALCESKDCKGKCFVYYVGRAAKEIGCECVS